MKKIIFILLSLCLLFSCQKYEVVMPDTSMWNMYNDPATLPLNPAARAAMEGVYSLSRGNDVFGDLAAVKWSHIIQGSDTIFHVSGFFGKDIAYFICEGKQLNGAILFNGYWRKMVSTETGIIHLTIGAGDGAGLLLDPHPVIDSGKITINGLFGSGQEAPNRVITLSYIRKLNRDPAAFQIAAHRSGGRTSDLLPVSENTRIWFNKSRNRCPLYKRQNTHSVPRQYTQPA